MTKGLIIVVEDDQTVLQLYHQALSSVGYTVLTASSGERASVLLSQHTPRTLILDIDLPGLSGIDVCRRVRGRLTAPIIFITANEDLSILRACIEAGGDDFLLKGVGIDRILERVSYWSRISGRKISEESRNRILERIEVKDTEAAETEGTVITLELDDEVLNSPEMRRIVRLFHSALEKPSLLEERSVKGRMARLGYVTGLVNAAAGHSLLMKLRFNDYLRTALSQTGVAQAHELDMMLQNWHELYSKEVFADFCKKAEADFEDG